MRTRRDDGWVLELPGASAGRPRLRLPQDGSAAPSVLENDSFLVVFDGALYNRRDVIAGVSARNGEPHDDAALLLAAYRRWGSELLQRVKGIFALVVWDGNEGRLLAARDPLGIYPLFYADAGTALALSTSIEALVQQPNVSSALNPVALALRLSGWWGYLSDVEETDFTAVRRLPPGHRLQVDGTARRISRYWHALPRDSPIDWTKEDEVDQFEALFREAVRRRVAPGKTAIFLSGGIDSAAVALVAAEESRRLEAAPPVALSLVFPPEHCNEEAVQRAVAARFGLPQVLLPTEEAGGPGGVVQAALEMGTTSPRPLIALAEPFYHRLGLHAAERGCRVILTGGGGDEWLSVDPEYAADLIRAFDLGGLYRLWDSRRRYLPGSGLGFAAQLLWGYGARIVLQEALRARPGAWQAYRRVRKWPALPPWLAPEPRIRSEIGERAERNEAAWRGGSRYLYTLARTMGSPITAEYLETRFEHGRRMGIQVLQPFWDEDLVRFLARTPPKLLHQGGRTKAFARRLLAPQFPWGLDWPRTVLADTFLASVLQNEALAAWKRLGSTRALGELGVVDRHRADNVLEDGLQGAATIRPREAWYLLALENWARSRL